MYENIDKILYLTVAVIVGFAIMAMLQASGGLSVNPVGDVFAYLIKVCRVTCGG